MSNTDPSNLHGPSDVTPAAGAPPVIPPSLPETQKGKVSGLTIAVICAGLLVILLAIGTIAVGLTLRASNAKAREAQLARETKQKQARASAPPTRPTKAPEKQLEQLAASSTRDVAAMPATSELGLSYTNVKVASEPWSIHTLAIDRSRKDLSFFSAHARDKVLGVSLLRDQARGLPRDVGRAVAAVNGDFYIRDKPPYSGDPRGLQILNGDLISAPDTVCIWFDASGNPHLDEVKGLFHITWPDGRKMPFGLNEQRQSGAAVLYTPTYGASTFASGGRELILEKDGESPWLPLQAGQTYRARVREIRTEGNTRLVPDAMVLSFAPQMLAGLPGVAPGAVLQISTATAPDLKGVKAAMGGGPALVKDGKAAFTLKTAPPEVLSDWTQRSKYEPHPRTAVGWSPTHIYLVIVDGRQPGLSVGMKLAELAEYFLSLGCTDAMNLDGGKSAQMWLNGEIMNSPCQGEDTVASSLLVVRKPAGQ